MDTVDVRRAQVTISQTVRHNGLMLADASVNLASIHVRKFVPVRFPVSLKEALQHYV